MSPIRRSDAKLDKLIEHITVEVLSVSSASNRRELVAPRQRGGRRYEVALLDIDLNADPATSQLLAGYRRWIGA